MSIIQPEDGAPVVDINAPTEDNFDQVIVNLLETAGREVRKAIMSMQAAQIDMTHPVTLKEVEDNQTDLQIEMALQQALGRIHRRVLTKRVEADRKRARAENDALTDEQFREKYKTARERYENAGTRRLEGEAI